MGNTPLTIGLRIDNHDPAIGIMAGSVVYGRIYLSVQDRAVDARAIRLKLIGTEVAVVHHTTSETVHENESHHHHGSSSSRRGNHHRHHNRTEQRDHYERFSDTIYQVDRTMKDFPTGVIPRGQYEFPFAIQLPKSLPSSMQARSGESHCEVRYELIAEVFQKPNSLLHKNPNTRENLTVVAMPRVSSDHDTSLHLPAEAIPISDCDCCCCAGCTRIGTMALEAKFDKTTMLLDSPSKPLLDRRKDRSSLRGSRRQPYHASHDPTKTFGVEFRCQNKSTAKARSVQAKLTETIEWSVNGHTKSVKTTLATTTKDASLYSELNPMWRKPFRFEEHRGGEINLLQPWRTMDPALAVEAAKTTDTYRGRVVQVRHVLSVNVVTEGYCRTDADASALVELYRNPLMYEGAATPAAAASTGAMQHTPSAPFEDELYESSAASYATPQSSAPPSNFDDNNKSDFASSAEVPFAQAELVLPENWNAQTAELVTIPIAEATILDPS